MSLKLKVVAARGGGFCGTIEILNSEEKLLVRWDFQRQYWYHGTGRN